MVAEPGMPRVRVGMNVVCDAALFAASGRAAPSMAPFPEREGSAGSRFSTM